jgi:2C-methyl-D-erythritol 2,4-cyclodiphosphate synthase
MLWERVGSLPAGPRLAIDNIDSTVIAQSPRLAAYIPTMCSNIAFILKIKPDQVSVLSTTTEDWLEARERESLPSCSID